MENVTKNGRSAMFIAHCGCLILLTHNERFPPRHLETRWVKLGGASHRAACRLGQVGIDRYGWLLTEGKVRLAGSTAEIKALSYIWTVNHAMPKWLQVLPWRLT